MKILKVIGIVGLLLTFTIPVYSADYTIRDKNYKTEGYVNDGKIHDRATPYPFEAVSLNTPHWSEILTDREISWIDRGLLEALGYE